MLEEIERYTEQRADFGFETTLAGKTYLKTFKEMKATGYRLNLYFLWLQSPELALRRVAERASMGGHAVPAQTILRRFDRGLHNLFHLYRQFLDSWLLFDNSGEVPRLIAKEALGKTTVIDGALFQLILKNTEVS